VHFFHKTIHIAAQSETDHIVKKPAASLSGIIDKTQLADINGLGFPEKNSLDNLFRGNREQRTPGKIAAGSKGYEAHHQVFSPACVKAHQAVDHLVECAVASHADDSRGPLHHCYSRHLDGISFFLGIHDVSGHFPSVNKRFYPRPLTANGSFAGHRIYDKHIPGGMNHMPTYGFSPFNKGNLAPVISQSTADLKSFCINRKNQNFIEKTVCFVLDHQYA
jgi:hypothetical protein